MNWLDKLDAALDRAFLPPPTHPKPMPKPGNGNDKGGNSDDDDNDNASGKNVESNESIATIAEKEEEADEFTYRHQQHRDLGLAPPSPRMERDMSGPDMVMMLHENNASFSTWDTEATMLEENIDSVEEGLFLNQSNGIAANVDAEISQEKNTVDASIPTQLPVRYTQPHTTVATAPPAVSYKPSMVVASSRASPTPGRIMRRVVPPNPPPLPPLHNPNKPQHIDNTVGNESQERRENDVSLDQADQDQKEAQLTTESNEFVGQNNSIHDSLSVIDDLVVPLAQKEQDQKEMRLTADPNDFFGQNNNIIDSLSVIDDLVIPLGQKDNDQREVQLTTRSNDLSGQKNKNDSSSRIDGIGVNSNKQNEHTTAKRENDKESGERELPLDHTGQEWPTELGDASGKTDGRKSEQEYDEYGTVVEDRDARLIENELGSPGVASGSMERDDGWSEESIELSENDMAADFLLPPVLTAWDEDEVDATSPSTKSSFEPRMNCHGVVHVRLFRAQRLPCPSGSTVHAAISLPPWKGRIRSSKIEASYGPSDAGVCLRWDHHGDSLDGSGHHGRNEQTAQCSMVHAYNSEDTPVPSISIKLVMSSPLQVFESDFFTLVLSCEPLMRNPGIWRRRWCSDSSPAKPIRDGGVSDNMGDEILFNDGYSDVVIHDARGIVNHPLLLLEACFEPSDFGTKNDASTLSASAKLPSSLPPVNEEVAEVPHLIMPETLGVALERPPSDNSSVAFSTSSDSRAPLKRLSANAHLFRVMSSLTPAWCSVCGCLMTGWIVQSYRCEVCSILCCSDCQLQVDVELPCGSDLAVAAAEKTLTSRFSGRRILSAIAPVSNTEENKNGTKKDTAGLREHEMRPKSGTSDELNQSMNSTTSTQIAGQMPGEMPRKEGIGKLRLRIISAHLLKRAFPPEIELIDVMNSGRKVPRSGDHYVRVSWTGSKDTKRTRTIFQTSKPLFEEEMNFIVDHYGLEYRVEVIDANTDRPVGISLITAQGVLQWQRDQTSVEQGITLSSIMHPHKEKVKRRRMALELRTGVKDGFGLNFYNSKSQETAASKKERTRAGEIMGWIEVDICLEEDLDLIYSSDPRQCAPRPVEDFNVELIQLHIARIGAIVDDISKVIKAYNHMVSWKDPKLTLSSFIILVATCVMFDAEYIGSLPIFCLLVLMVHLARIRIRGDFKSKWIHKEKKARIEAEKKMAVNYSVHRPTGRLEVQVLQGKNLRSRELGIPGTPFASVLWDPTRFASERVRKKMIQHDSTAGSAHEIGVVKSSGVGLTANPRWDKIEESSELRRMRQLMPNKQFWTDKDLQTVSQQKKDKIDLQRGASQSLDFPILQPIKPSKKRTNSDGSSGESIAMELAPWETSHGAIVVQVRSKLPVFEDVLGEVVVPLKHLVQENEILGWFKLLDVGTKEMIRGNNVDDQLPDNVKMENDLNRNQVKEDQEEDSHSLGEISKDESAEVFLKMKFSNITSEKQTSDSDQETSIVIAEEMIRFASMASDNKIGMIGSSINTINTVRGIGGTIQNHLSSIIDVVESIRNAFNFSSPFQSTLLFLFLAVLWLVLILIPTRLFFLFGIIGQYIATFVAAYFPKKEIEKIITEEERFDDENKEAKDNPFVVKFINFFRAIPTDEDLRRTYFWEARRVGEREREKLATKKRTLRLEKLWHTQWSGNIKLKDKISGAKVGGTSQRSWDWEDIFAILEGHRFIYWRDVKHFDDGEEPLGQIFFAGHSGLAGLSPLDLRELTKDEIPLVVSIFGRGVREQQKISVLTLNEDEKNQLEDAVMKAAFDIKND
uniref:C2 domain-containing protein n=1 Tax=Ditylum brightwellii TaxID=49249 RepID=A0A7S4W2P0_9STRA